MNTEPGLERKIRRSIYRASDLQHKQVHNLFGELGLFPGQTFVLYALWDQDGLTQSELTARLNRSPSTITKKVQRMEKAGFVERRPDPTDERVSRVYLTEVGRSVQDEVKKVWRTLEDETFRTFGPEERTRLRRFFLQMRDNLIRVNQGKPTS